MTWIAKEWKEQNPRALGEMSTSHQGRGRDPTVPLADQAAWVLILKDFKSCHKGERRGGKEPRAGV